MARRSIIQVSGSVVRCTGPTAAPHAETVIRLPMGKPEPCPRCGQRFERAPKGQVSNAIWPQRK